jgi:hypothetical protein
MRQLSTVSSTNRRVGSRAYLSSVLKSSILSFRKIQRLAYVYHGAMFLLSAAVLLCGSPSLAAAQETKAEPQRESIQLSVVVVNPSKIKEQSVPIKMDLPQEVTPDAILDAAGLDIEFDAEKSAYYVYKDEVKLNAAETKVFNIELKDVWVIPRGRLDSLKSQTNSIIGRLEGSEFYDSAKLLGETIIKTLDTVAVTQNDVSVSRKSHIGIYRNNLQIVEKIKEDIARMEKQLAIAQSLPKPEVLENKKLQTESPAKSTSWMIIFIIMLFIAMLAGVFFFTWQTQANATRNQIADAREASFPKGKGPDDKT